MRRIASLIRYDLGLDQTVYTATAVATQAERHAERRRASAAHGGGTGSAVAGASSWAPNTAEALEAAYAAAPEVIEGPAAFTAEAQAAPGGWDSAVKAPPGVKATGVKATGVKATGVDSPFRPPSESAAPAGSDASPPEASLAVPMSSGSGGAPSRAAPLSSGSGDAPTIPPPETARATSPPPLPSRPAPSTAQLTRVSGARLGGRALAAVSDTAGVPSTGAVAGASGALPSVARLRYTGDKLPFQRLMDATKPSPATAAAAAANVGSPPSGASSAVAGELQGGRVKEPLTVTAARRSQPVLDAVQSQLRKQRVYVTTNSGTVLSLRAGADLQVALEALRLRGLPHEAAATTARVNGRTVRREYKLRNGDVLMPLATTTLNSYAWVATGTGSTAESSTYGEAVKGAYAWGEAAEALATAPTPVPYPWSLVGSRRAEDALSWLREAEKKHGSVASLALANWCVLYTH